MLVGSRRASVFMLLAVMAAACTKRGLQPGGTGQIGIDAGPGDGGAISDAGPVGPGDGDGGLPAIDGNGGLLPTDAGESACVTAAVLLPWMRPSAALARLDVATAGDTVAVMNRTPDMLDVRTYGRDGTVVGGFQFAADAQFLPYRDGRYLLMTRGVTGAFSATAIDPNLVGGTRLYGAPSSATEHVLAALPLADSTVLITDERFVKVGVTSAAAAWSDVLGADDAGTLAASNIYGMAAQADRVLIAWGSYSTLYLAVLDTSGALVARAHYPAFFDSLGATTASAIPWGTGLLLFDSNGAGSGGVRLTQLGFDLSRTTLGDNKQMRAFYRTTPRVAGVALPAVPLAFWLTVFPQTDNSQGYTTHQLYGCVLDLAAPSTCVTTALIAATGLDGYGIADEPVAAAAFSDGSTFAIAHTDVNGRSWLRVADFSCAPLPPPAP